VHSGLLDDDVRAFLAEQSARVAKEFGKELSGRELPLLEWGDQPELRFLTADGRPRLFLSRDAPDWWRIRYQIAHEVFHWLCSPPQTFHWTHELLAVETAVRAMEEIGEHGYAEKVTATLTAEAARLPLARMLTTRLDEGYYPDGLYGRAWTTGRQLIAAVGWETVKLLAGSSDDTGKPDALLWIRSLSPQDQAEVEEVLGVPSPKWV
jgi:hypothetical protein